MENILMTIDIPNQLVHITCPECNETYIKTIDELKKIEHERGYKPGWAHHVWREREKKRTLSSPFPSFTGSLKVALPAARACSAASAP